MVHRVVITGLGAVTPIGVGASTSFRNLLEGQCGLKNILKSPDWSGLYSIAHSLSLNWANIVTEVPQINSKSCLERIRIPRAFKFAEIAANEALQDAGFTENTENIGAYVGCGMPGASEMYDNCTSISENKLKVSPYFIPSILGNSAAGHVARKFGLKGPTSSPSVACATGSYAIGEAYRFLRDEMEVGCEALLAGATETPINAPSLLGFNRIKALSRAQMSRPFDQDRDGFVLGEGSGMLVLERLCSALRRNAKIYAEIIGFGCTNDAYHPTSPDPSNSSAIAAIRSALNTQHEHNLVALNAHATSTPIGDKLEVSALEASLPILDNIYLTSNKGAIGHLLGAAGAVESIFTILSLYNQQLPPNLNLINRINTKFTLPIQPVKLNLFQNSSILKTSFGFGGVNTALLFKKY